MKRGIITNVGTLKRTSKDTVIFSHQLKDEDINYYSLYWDKIVIPFNNIFRVGINHQEDLLKAGVLITPEVRFPSWSSNSGDASFDPFIVSQSIVANEYLTNDKSVDWTIHQLGDQIVIGNEQKREYNSIKVELANCLPVPNDEVNLNEIFEFKEKRKDELLSLHESIDEVYFEILSSVDRDLQTKKSIIILNQNIKNLQSVSKEKFKSLTKYNFTAELNISGKNISTGIAAGALIDFYSNGFTIPIATILSGAASILNIKANRATSIEKAQNRMKLSYLAKASKKDIINL